MSLKGKIVAVISLGMKRFFVSSNGLIIKSSLICFMALSLSSLSQSLKPGDIILTTNIGVPHLFKTIVKRVVQTPGFHANFNGHIEVTKIRGWNPIAIKGEYGVNEFFSIGANYSFWTLKFDVNDYYNLQNQSNGAWIRDSVDIYHVDVTSTSIGLRPVLHIPLDTYRHDIYFGLGLGITKNGLSIGFSSTDAGRLANKVRKDLKLDLSLPGGIYFAPSIGYRAYFNPFVGMNFELGYEKGAIIQVGMVFKFNLNEATRKNEKKD